MAYSLHSARDLGRARAAASRSGSRYDSNHAVNFQPDGEVADGEKQAGTSEESVSRRPRLLSGRKEGLMGAEGGQRGGPDGREESGGRRQKTPIAVGADRNPWSSQLDLVQSVDAWGGDSNAAIHDSFIQTPVPTTPPRHPGSAGHRRGLPERNLQVASVLCWRLTSPLYNQSYTQRKGTGNC